MNQTLAAVAMVTLLFLTGCTNVVDKATDDETWLLKIDERLGQKDYDYCLDEATKYVEKYPDSASGWCLLGWVYVKSDDPVNATESFDKALAIDSKWDNAYVGKGVSYRAQGDNKKARESYLEAIKITPNNAEAYSSLQVIEILEGNDVRAVEYGEKAWSLRKDLATIPANLAVAYHYLGDTEKRDLYFNHAKRLNYSSLDTLQEIFDGTLELR